MSIPYFWELQTYMDQQAYEREQLVPPNNAEHITDDEKHKMELDFSGQIGYCHFTDWRRNEAARCGL